MQVTDAPLGVESFDWSDDGASLAFTARVPEKGRYGSVEGLDAAAEAPRRITGVRWHSNGLGYIADRPSHLFVVAAPASTTSRSTSPPQPCARRVRPLRRRSWSLTRRAR